MKVLKITCNDKSELCHAEVVKTNPNMVSMVHYPNNHILIDAIDYDNNGHVKKSAWKIDEENKLDEEIKNKMRVSYEKEFV